MYSVSTAVVNLAPHEQRRTCDEGQEHRRRWQHRERQTHESSSRGNLHRFHQARHPISHTGPLCSPIAIPDNSRHSSSSCCCCCSSTSCNSTRAHLILSSSSGNTAPCDNAPALRGDAFLPNNNAAVTISPLLISIVTVISATATTPCHVRAIITDTTVVVYGGTVAVAINGALCPLVDIATLTGGTPIDGAPIGCTPIGGAPVAANVGRSRWKEFRLPLRRRRWRRRGRGR